MRWAIRLHRFVAITVIGAGLLLSGCAQTGVDGATNPSPSNPSAQSDLRPPVAAAAADPTTPVRLALGDRDAPIDAVATDAQGALYPPTDVARLGWWVDSALPGSGAGSVVVTGHVDDARQGDGFAKRFASLTPGTEVSVAGRDGQTARYRVTRTLSVHKGQLPVDDLNRLDGPETLILVTCGGAFIGPPLGYENNDVIYAERA